MSFGEGSGAGTSSAGNLAQVAKDAMLEEESFTRGSVVMEMRFDRSARLQVNLPVYLNEEARPAELAEERCPVT